MNTQNLSRARQEDQGKWATRNSNAAMDKSEDYSYDSPDDDENKKTYHNNFGPD